MAADKKQHSSAAERRSVVTEESRKGKANVGCLPKAHH